MSKIPSWDDHRIFLAVLEAGSLAGAARNLGLSHPTVRSRIEAFEKDLGAVLFTRSVNGLSPTQTAEALRETAQTMANAAHLFQRQASAPASDIAGPVRISVPDIMGVEVIPGMLQPLLEFHPHLKIELSLSNTQADVLTHEVDIAVRTVTPSQSSLIARRIARYEIGFFASPHYLERKGVPMTMSDFANHAIIGPDRDPIDLAIAARLGPNFAPECFVLRTDSHPAQLSAARMGIGIAVCPVPLARKDPHLVRVVPDVHLHMLDVWTVTHENLSRIPRIRSVLDHLAASFGSLQEGG